MNINGPVHCQSFFKDQIQQKQEGLWCVSLRPNGHLEELIGVSEPKEDDCQKLLGSLVQRGDLKMQLLVVRLSPDQFLFDSQDWIWVEEVLNYTRTYKIQFCDYLKVSEGRFSSLIRYEDFN